MTSRPLLLLGALCALLPSLSARASMVEIVAVADTTLYTDPNPFGPRANSLGDYFFAGNTSGGNPGQTRRAILAFDVASFLPVGAVVQSVALSVSVSRVPGDTPGVPTHMFTLHRATTSWTEGSSNAPGSEGTGTDPTPGDATWLHSAYDTAFWSSSGGDFAAAPSASLGIGYLGFYQFSSAQMVADVQAWLDAPSADFGWFLLGDETQSATGRRFDSRNQAGNSDGWPLLTVQYTVVPEPATGGLLALFGLALPALLHRGRRKRGRA